MFSKYYKFFFFILLTNFSLAQDVTIKDDIVLIDKSPSFKIKKKNAGMMRNDFIVYSLNDIELIYFKSTLGHWVGSGGYMYGDKELYYEVNFTKTHNYAYVRHQNIKSFAKLVIDNKLIMDNEIDPTAELRFLHLNDGVIAYKEKEEKEKSQPISINLNLNRDSNSVSITSITPNIQTKNLKPIFEGTNILIDSLNIGRYKLDTIESSFSQKEYKLTVYSDVGDKIGEATAPFLNPKEWKVTTFNDKKSHDILYDYPKEKETLIKWLISRKYLIY